MFVLNYHNVVHKNQIRGCIWEKSTYYKVLLKNFLAKSHHFKGMLKVAK